LPAASGYSAIACIERGGVDVWRRSVDLYQQMPADAPTLNVPGMTAFAQLKRSWPSTSSHQRSADAVSLQKQSSDGIPG